MSGLWDLYNENATYTDLATSVDQGIDNPSGVLRIQDEKRNTLVDLALANPGFELGAGVATLPGQLQVAATAKGKLTYVQLLDRDRVLQAEGRIDSAGAAGAVIDADRVYLEPGDTFTVRSLTLSALGGAVAGAGSASTFTAGDRNVNLVSADSRLAGGSSFASVAGARIAVACRESGRVVVVASAEPRNLPIVGMSAVLDPPPVALASDSKYIYAYCRQGGQSPRALVVLTNATTPVEVERIVIDSFQDDQAEWIALNEAEGVLAYPVDSAVAALLDTNTLEEIDRAWHGAKSATSAVWTTFALANRPLVGTTENRRAFLYVKSPLSKNLGALELNRFYESGVLTSQEWWSVGQVPLPAGLGAQRISFGDDDLITTGAVAARGAITPIFEGARKVSDGSYLAVWGYDNPTGVAVYQPRTASGYTRNWMVGLDAGAQGALPEVFKPGRVRRAVVLQTTGEALTWVLQPPSGGGAASADYSVAASVEGIDAQTLLAFDLAQGRYYRFEMTSPTEVADEWSTEVLSPAMGDLLGAGVLADGSAVRHTRPPNDDLQGVTRWWARNASVRVEAGWLSLHGKSGHLTKYAPPELALESSRGEVFSLPEGTVESFPVIYQDLSVAQDGESMGWEIGNSGDGRIIALSAESYYGTDGAYQAGRAHLFLGREDGTAVPVGVVLPTDAGIPFSPDLKFSRFTEVNYAGDRLFLGGKNSPGVAVFALDSSGRATFHNLLTWPEYTAFPAFERCHEARVSKDGKILLMSLGDRFGGTSTVPGQVHVLYSEDNWATFEVRKVFSRSDADGTADGFTTLDCNDDCTVLGIGAWRKGKAYVYRTTDNWATFTEYPLTAPAAATASSQFGISMAVSSDGFLVSAGAPQATVGGAANAGLVASYNWDQELGRYELVGVLTHPDAAGAGSKFGNAIRFNAPGSRLSVIAPGVPKQFLYAVRGESLIEIASLDDAFTAGSADTRWLATSDTLIVANKSEDNGGLASVGAFRLIRFPEAP